MRAWYHEVVHVSRPKSRRHRAEQHRGDLDFERLTARRGCRRPKISSTRNAMAMTVAPLPRLGGCICRRKAEVLNQVFSICELVHSVRSRPAGQSGSVEDFSHDRIREATHNRRRGNPGYWIGNLDRTGLCRRTIIAGRPLRRDCCPSVQQQGGAFLVTSPNCMSAVRRANASAADERVRLA